MTAEQVEIAITNRLHESHPLRSGRSGIEEWAKLAVFMETNDGSALRPHLGAIDELFEKTLTSECACSGKICAFMEVFCEGRLPEEHKRWSKMCDERIASGRNKRDYRQEVQEAIAQYA